MYYVLEIYTFAFGWRKLHLDEIGINDLIPAHLNVNISSKSNRQLLIGKKFERARKERIMSRGPTTLDLSEFSKAELSVIKMEDL